jgi:endoglucanase
MVSSSVGRGAIALVAVLALVATIFVGAPAQALVLPAPTPVVQGNQLIDSRTNTVFTPHGVNWPSFEYACWQGWGYSGDNSTAEAQAIASWQANTVRLPLNQDCWLGLQNSPAGSGRTAAGYQAAVRSWVDKLNAAGLVVILDLHSSAPVGYQAHGQRAMADAQSVTFWQQVSNAYKSVPSVMFDLFNEPYSRWDGNTRTFDLTWACWKNGGCQAPVEDDYTSPLSGATFSTAGMTQLVAAVRDSGAGQPIMLGGIDYSNDLRGWLANRPADTQLVASWDNYPGQRCQTATCWNAEVAPVAAVVPVVTGEFGQTDGGSAFLTTFMNWADAHGVGYMPWAWWHVPVSESLENSRYALIADDGFEPKAPSGTVYHDHLATLVTQPPALPHFLTMPLAMTPPGSAAASASEPLAAPAAVALPVPASAASAAVSSAALAAPSTAICRVMPGGEHRGASKRAAHLEPAARMVAATLRILAPARP